MKLPTSAPRPEPEEAPPSGTVQREVMIATDLRARGITDPRVLAAFRAVPRELFVPDAAVEHAYEDHPLSIGARQTISQPFVVAEMLEALRLRGDEKVLEIGTGTGYSAALLTHLAEVVYTVERLESLYRDASDRLRAFGYDVRCKLGDGTLGWPEHAPYDAIIVAAAGPVVPPSLVAQLAPCGRLVMPVGDERHQFLKLVRKEPERDGDVAARIEEQTLDEVGFVPLIGAEGRPDHRTR
ncbi:MAG: protein-L-isoaspartate(D-aspartate) O-methyltransferase [Polyangiaceae bacterium]